MTTTTATLSPAARIANEYIETVHTLRTLELRADYADWLASRKAAHAQGLFEVVTQCDRVLAAIVMAGKVRTAPGAALRNLVWKS